MRTEHGLSFLMIAGVMAYYYEALYLHPKYPKNTKQINLVEQPHKAPRQRDTSTDHDSGKVMTPTSPCGHPEAHNNLLAWKLESLCP